MIVSNKNINESLGSIDIFICSSGFEPRTKSLSKSINRKAIDYSLAFHMEETYAVSYKNLESIKANLNQLEIIKYPKNRPLETFDLFYNKIVSLVQNNTKNIVVDITTFTREVLLILLKILSLEECCKKANIKLVYTPAEKYPDTWLTKGIRDIRSIYGYSGLNHPSKKCF